MIRSSPALADKRILRVRQFTDLKSSGRPLPQLAGEGGAKRRMGCGPPLRPKSDCATALAGPFLLSAPHPAFGHLPRSAEKGWPVIAMSPTKSIAI